MTKIKKLAGNSGLCDYYDVRIDADTTSDRKGFKGKRYKRETNNPVDNISVEIEQRSK